MLLDPAKAPTRENWRVEVILCPARRRGLRAVVLLLRLEVQVQTVLLRRRLPRRNRVDDCTAHGTTNQVPRLDEAVNRVVGFDALPLVMLLE